MSASFSTEYILSLTLQGLDDLKALRTELELLRQDAQRPIQFQVDVVPADAAAIGQTVEAEVAKGVKKGLKGATGSGTPGQLGTVALDPASVKKFDESLGKLVTAVDSLVKRVEKPLDIDAEGIEQAVERGMQAGFSRMPPAPLAGQPASIEQPLTPMRKAELEVQKNLLERAGETISAKSTGSAEDIKALERILGERARLLGGVFTKQLEEIRAKMREELERASEGAETKTNYKNTTGSVEMELSESLQDVQKEYFLQLKGLMKASQKAVAVQYEELSRTLERNTETVSSMLGGSGVGAEFTQNFDRSMERLTSAMTESLTQISTVFDQRIQAMIEVLTRMPQRIARRLARVGGGGGGGGGAGTGGFDFSEQAQTAARAALANNAVVIDREPLVEHEPTTVAGELLGDPVVGVPVPPSSKKSRKVNPARLAANQMYAQPPRVSNAYGLADPAQTQVEQARLRNEAKVAKQATEAAAKAEQAQESAAARRKAALEEYEKQFHPLEQQKIREFAQRGYVAVLRTRKGVAVEGLGIPQQRIGQMMDGPHAEDPEFFAWKNITRMRGANDDARRALERQRRGQQVADLEIDNGEAYTFGQARTYVGMASDMAALLRKFQRAAKAVKPDLDEHGVALPMTEQDVGRKMIAANPEMLADWNRLRHMPIIQELLAPGRPQPPADFSQLRAAADARFEAVAKGTTEPAALKEAAAARQKEHDAIAAQEAEYRERLAQFKRSAGGVYSPVPLPGFLAPAIGTLKGWVNTMKPALNLSTSYRLATGPLPTAGGDYFSPLDMENPRAISPLGSKALNELAQLKESLEGELTVMRTRTAPRGAFGDKRMKPAERQALWRKRRVDASNKVKELEAEIRSRVAPFQAAQGIYSLGDLDWFLVQARNQLHGTHDVEEQMDRGRKFYDYPAEVQTALDEQIRSYESLLAGKGLQPAQAEEFRHKIDQVAAIKRYGGEWINGQFRGFTFMHPGATPGVRESLQQRLQIMLGDREVQRGDRTVIEAAYKAPYAPGVPDVQIAPVQFPPLGLERGRALHGNVAREEPERDAAARLAALDSEEAALREQVQRMPDMLKGLAEEVRIRREEIRRRFGVDPRGGAARRRLQQSAVRRRVIAEAEQLIRDATESGEALRTGMVPAERGGGPLIDLDADALEQATAGGQVDLGPRYTYHHVKKLAELPRTLMKKYGVSSLDALSRQLQGVGEPDPEFEREMAFLVSRDRAAEAARARHAALEQRLSEIPAARSAIVSGARGEDRMTFDAAYEEAFSTQAIAARTEAGKVVSPSILTPEAAAQSRATVDALNARYMGAAVQREEAKAAAGAAAAQAAAGAGGNGHNGGGGKPVLGGFFDDQNPEHIDATKRALEGLNTVNLEGLITQLRAINAALSTMEKRSVTGVVSEVIARKNAKLEVMQAEATERSLRDQRESELRIATTEAQERIRTREMLERASGRHVLTQSLADVTDPYAQSYGGLQFGQGLSAQALLARFGQSRSGMSSSERALQKVLALYNAKRAPASGVLRAGANLDANAALLMSTIGQASGVVPGFSDYGPELSHYTGQVRDRMGLEDLLDTFSTEKRRAGTKGLPQDERRTAAAAARAAIADANKLGIKSEQDMIAALAERRKAEAATREAILQRATEEMAAFKEQESHVTALERFGNKMRSLAMYAGAGFFLYGLSSRIMQDFGESRQLQSNMAQLQGIGGGSLATRNQLQSAIFANARRYGVNPLQLSQSALTMYPEFRGGTASALSDSLMAQRGLGFDESQASQFLTAVNAQTGGKITGQDMLDRIARLEARYPVNAKDLATVVQRVGTITGQLQPTEGGQDSYSALLGMATQIMSETRATGEQTATALRTMMSNLTNPAVQGKLQQFGVMLGGETPTDMRPLMDILHDTAKVYQQLKESGASGQAANLLVSVGGARQAPYIAALFDDFAKAEKSAADAAMAYGDSQRRLALSLDTLDAKFSQFGATFFQFFNSLMEKTGLMWALGGLAGGSSSLLGRAASTPGGSGMLLAGAGAGVLGAQYLAKGVASRLGSYVGGKFVAREGAGLLGFLGENTGAAAAGAAGSSLLTGIGEFVLGVGVLAAVLEGLKTWWDHHQETAAHTNYASTVDVDQLRQSEAYQQYTAQAATYGLTPAGLYRATAAASAQAQADVRGRKLGPGYGEALEAALTKRMEAQLPGLAQQDPETRRAAVLSILRGSYLQGSAVASTAAAGLGTVQDQAYNELAARLSGTTLASVPASGVIINQLGTPGSGVAANYGLASRSATPLDYGYTYNGRAASRFHYGLTGRGLDAGVHSDVATILGSVFGGTAASGIGGLQLIDSAGKSVGTALDFVAHQIETKGSSIGQALDDMVTKFYGAGTTGPLSATVTQNRANLDRMLMQGMNAAYNITGQAQVAQGKQVGLTGGDMSVMTAPGAKANKFMLDEIQRVADAARKQLIAQGRAKDAADLEKTADQLTSPDNRNRMALLIAKSGGKSAIRDRILDILIAYNQANMATSGEEGIYGAGGLRIGGQFNQQRISSTDTALKGLLGVRGAMIGDLARLRNRRQQLLESGGFTSNEYIEDATGALHYTGGDAKQREILGKVMDLMRQTPEAEQTDQDIKATIDALNAIKSNADIVSYLDPDTRKELFSWDGQGGTAFHTLQDVIAALAKRRAAFESIAVGQQRTVFDVGMLGTTRMRQLQSAGALARQRSATGGRFAQVRGQIGLGLQYQVGGVYQEHAADVAGIMQNFANQRAQYDAESHINGMYGGQAYTQHVQELDAQRAEALAASNDKLVLALEELRDTVQLDVAQRKQQTIDEMSSSASSGFLSVLSGGYAGIRRLHARDGAGIRELGPALLDPITDTLNQRMAHNLMDSLVGKNGVLAGPLSKVFGADMFQTEADLIFAAHVRGIVAGFKQATGQGGSLVLGSLSGLPGMHMPGIGAVTPAGMMIVGPHAAALPASALPAVGMPGLSVIPTVLGGVAGARASVITSTGMHRAHMLPAVRTVASPIPHTAHMLPAMRIVAQAGHAGTTSAGGISIPLTAPMGALTGKDSNGIPYYLKASDFTSEQLAELRSKYGVSDPSRLHYNEDGVLEYDTRRKTRHSGLVPTERLDAASGRLPGETWEAYEARVKHASYGAEPDSIRSLSALDPAVRDQFAALYAAARKAGFPVSIGETRRSASRQEWLFANRPGATYTLTSNHMGGRAVDFQLPNAKDYARFQAWVKTQPGGFQTLGSWDPGHVELPLTPLQQVLAGGGFSNPFTPGNFNGGPGPLKYSEHAVYGDVPDAMDVILGKLGRLPVEFAAPRPGVPSISVPRPQVAQLPDDPKADLAAEKAVRRHQLLMSAAYQATQIGGAYLGTALGVKGPQGNYSDLGSSVGSVLGSFLPIPGGSIIGGLVGGLFGGRFGRGKPAPPEYQVLQAIEQHTRVVPDLLKEQTKLLSLNATFLNAPASFSYIPKYSVTGGSGATGGHTFNITVNASLAQGVTAEHVAQQVTKAISQQLGAAGTFSTIRRG